MQYRIACLGAALVWGMWRARPLAMADRGGTLSVWATFYQFWRLIAIGCAVTFGPGRRAIEMSAAEPLLRELMMSLK